MIKYDFEIYSEWEIKNIHVEEVSLRQSWIDVYLAFIVENTDAIPEDLTTPSALLIYSSSGEIVQTILLDEGCDTEYRFTDNEKQTLLQFVRDNKLIDDLVK